jgi:predicted amidophosphoribosyltransferase
MHCGSSHPGASQFCNSCENDLWRAHENLQHFTIEPRKIPGVSLFDWYPNEDRKLSKLMISLKGGRLSKTFDYYAQAFVSRLGAIELEENTVLVPCPANSQRKHAFTLAQSISILVGAPIDSCLQKEEQHTSQKSKSRAERQKTEMTCLRNLSRKHVIFIDDIVTTGSTVLSARNAIGPCRSFKVWCLAHRR